MARPLYTISMVQVQGLNGALNVAVPLGVIWVVRCIAVYNGGGIAASTMQVKYAGAGTFANFSQASGAGGNSFLWNGRIVLNGGQSLGVHTDTPWDVAISGYQLTAP